MGSQPTQKETAAVRGYRFGPFDVNLRSGELRRKGIRLRLQDQPFTVLVAMLERPGEVVNREELRLRLWPSDTFVDFENSLNSAVNRLRDVLGDTAGNPQYVETLPRRGYRFIAPVEQVLEPEAVAPAPPAVSPSINTKSEPSVVAPRPRATRRWAWAAAALILLATVSAAFVWNRGRVAGAPAGKIVVAILPFEDLTGASDYQYFAAGLTEELILQLGQLRPDRLAVIARTTAQQYAQTRKPIEQVARELGAQFVLTGTVRGSAQPAPNEPGRLLISTQLVEARNQTSLWSESYEQQPRDFLQVQNDVAMQVTKSLASELMVDLQSAQKQLVQIRPEALTAFLKGRFYWNQRSQTGGENTRRAAELFKRAIELEPNYAAAHAAFASAQLSLATAGLMKMEEVVSSARTANTRALALQPGLAVAYLNLARIGFMYDHDWYGAEKLFQKALALDPNAADSHFYYAILLTALKRFAEADKETQAAMKLDPLGPSPFIIGAYIAERLGDADRAVEMSRRYGELLGDPLAHYHAAGTFLARAGRCAEARELLAKADAVPAANAALYAGDRATVLARCGDLPGALKARDAYFQITSLTDYHRAIVDAGLGRSAKACEWLRSAERNRDPSLAMLHMEPNFDLLRAEPCFQSLARRLNLP